MEMRASQVIKGALGGGAKKRKKVQDWGRNREREDEKEGERHFPIYVAVWDVTVIYRQRWKKKSRTVNFFYVVPEVIIGFDKVRNCGSDFRAEATVSDL